MVAIERAALGLELPPVIRISSLNWIESRSLNRREQTGNDLYTCAKDDGKAWR
jgi:hypothetical protein